MNTFNARNNIQRTVCATLATAVTVFAIAVATLAGRPYVLPGQAQVYVAAAGAGPCGDGALYAYQQCA